MQHVGLLHESCTLIKKQQDFFAFNQTNKERKPVISTENSEDFKTRQDHDSKGNPDNADQIVQVTQTIAVTPGPVMAVIFSSVDTDIL